MSTDILYIIGGAGSLPPFLDNKIYSYDIAAGGPIQMLPGTMSERKARLGCLVLDTDGKILAAQGIALPSWDSQPTSEIFDILTGQWTSVPYMLPWFALPGVSGPRIIEIQGTLASIFKEPGAIYVYDKANGQWKQTLNAPYKGHNRNPPIAIRLNEFRKCRPSWGNV